VGVVCYALWEVPTEAKKKEDDWQIANSENKITSIWQVIYKETGNNSQNELEMELKCGDKKRLKFTAYTRS
jgi:hypothetical protein